MQSFWKNIRSIYKHTLLVSSALVLIGTSTFGFTLQMQKADPVAAVDAATALYADRVVERGYLTVLNRRPDSAGRNFWYNQVAQNPDADWFVRAITQTPEYRNSSLRMQKNPQFITTVYNRSVKRNPTANEMLWWTTAINNGSASRAKVIAHMIENGFTFKLTRPVTYVPCSKFQYSGPKPLCKKGGNGATTSGIVRQVPGSNIIVNEVWYNNIHNLRQTALRSGYNLQAYRSPSVPNWMRSPGSWRSYADQKWLYENGFPANRPGTSMHEWGLAIDFSCNGSQAIHHNRACWNWLRANGGRYGVHNFHSVSQPHHVEAWHFSSNGR